MKHLFIGLVVIATTSSFAAQEVSFSECVDEQRQELSSNMVEESATIKAGWTTVGSITNSLEEAARNYSVKVCHETIYKVRGRIVNFTVFGASENISNYLSSFSLTSVAGTKEVELMDEDQVINAAVEADSSEAFCQYYVMDQGWPYSVEHLLENNLVETSLVPSFSSKQEAIDYGNSIGCKEIREVQVYQDKWYNNL